MDFGKLLHTAQKNEQSGSKTGVRYYSTKFEPPKKQKKNNHELSANIKKFLAKKEAEEKKKQEEEHKRREELLALRSQDRKATRRVNVMLKRTKSANQSVIDGAVDRDNTAVTLAGPLQPDEDDYGYVSQEAAAFYNKMMEKYSKMPDEPKFDMHRKKVSTNLGSTKDRVKAALEKEKEEAMMPHKRKRKHIDKKEEEDEEGISYGAPERGPSDSKGDREEKVVKPKPKPAPVLNFAELLKIAEKKQHEPIVIEKKEKDDTMLMTKKQKKEFERERESRQRREEKWRDYENKGSQSVKSPKSNGSKVDQPIKPSSPENKNKVSKVIKDDSKNFKIPATNRSVESKSTKMPQEGPPKKYLPGDIRAKNVDERKYLPGDIRNKSNAITEEKNTKKYLPGDIRGNTIPKKPPPIDKQKNPPNGEQPQRKFLPGDIRAKGSDQAQRKYPPTKNGSSESTKPTNNIDPQRKPPSLNGIKSKVSAENSKLGRAPIRDMKPKQFPPPDVRRSEGSLKKPSLPNKRRILDDDDDDEYDSEMDDFIDDGDGEGDYSKYISEIFGYDKSKYRDTEDDIDNMESTFAQQMREEVISTKIGIMEDLEDMKQEEEAKRKKLMTKKRKL